MKIYLRFALMLLSTLLLLGNVSGQAPGEQILAEVGESLLQGSADRLSNAFSTQVEITLQGKTQVHSRVQAQYVMTQFFQTNPPGSFNFQHKGETGGTVYALGEYRSANGASFEVNIFIRPEGSDDRVFEIRFD